jgi:hypothetical protein
VQRNSGVVPHGSHFLPVPALLSHHLRPYKSQCFPPLILMKVRRIRRVFRIKEGREANINYNTIFSMLGIHPYNLLIAVNIISRF